MTDRKASAETPATFTADAASLDAGALLPAPGSVVHEVRLRSDEKRVRKTKPYRDAYCDLCLPRPCRHVEDPANTLNRSVDCALLKVV